MDTSNQTAVKDFILLGLTRDPQLQVPLFIFFLLVYIITVLANTGLICLYHIDSHLHTPMYYFISKLSLVDLCYSTTITPKMLMGFIVDKNVISIYGCAVQLFFYVMFAEDECVIIALMAFDRYTAICKPLHYSLIMTENLCNKLTALSCVYGMTVAIIYIIITFSLSFCREDKITHYFCDVLPLFKLSCTDTAPNKATLFTIIAIAGLIEVIPIAMSYYSILIAILRTCSSSVKYKAFSTCSPHLVCVILFYGSGLNMYLRPNTMLSDEKDKVMSVFYTIIIAMINPLIYSLRNKDVKAAFCRILQNNR